MLRVFKNLKKREWLLIVIAIVFIVVQVWLDLKLPDYMSEITVLVQTEGSEMHEILTAGGKMLLCAFGSLVSAVAVAVLASKVAANFGATMRGKLFEKVQEFSMEEVGKFSTASLITRTTNDVQQVQMIIVMGFRRSSKRRSWLSGRSARSTIRAGSGRLPQRSPLPSCCFWFPSASCWHCPSSKNSRSIPMT